MVVEFFPDTPQAWVGNFQPGLAGYNAVLPHLDGTSLIVIAGGEAYVINPEERRLLTVFGGDIDLALVIPSLGLFVISSAGIHFEARDRTGLAWRTRRISWDGMQDIRIENDKLNGEAWSPIDNCYYPFSVDLRTGAVEGGSYNGPPG
ncbi:MAG TPA: hypothetical protein VMH80_26100 [Bryobacteraceae bacterium]|nr:hypothetical protein [Bryobacteraceae bacterium]